MTCKWCGSERHDSENCPTRNLVKLLNDEPLKEDAKLPDLLVITNENDIADAIEEVHALRHIKERKHPK